MADYDYGASTWAYYTTQDVCFYVYDTSTSSPAVYSTTASNLGDLSCPWIHSYI
jgi:hypothetical protein